MTGIHFTPNVRITNLTPQLLFGLMIIHQIYSENGVELWITSADDSKHNAGTLHGKGKAVDLRTKHMNGGNMGVQARKIAATMKANLSPQFEIGRASCMERV